MTEREGFDTFPITGEQARMIDRVCDEYLNSIEQGIEFPIHNILSSVSHEVQLPLLEQIMLIDRESAHNRGIEAKSKTQWAEQLTHFSGPLDAVWASLESIEDASRVSDNKSRTPSIVWPERFEVIRRLGAGSMGEVHLVRHRLLNRTVAVKVPFRLHRKQEEVLTRFHNEIQVLAQLDHPGIARAIDADLIDGHLFLVMEYIEGQTLQEIVSQQGVLSWQKAVSYLSQVADALAYAHSRNVLHRDVKPGNLILTPQGRVILLDLGLARLIDSQTRAPVTPGFSGTPDFAAPEQQFSTVLTEQCDIYGLGSTLYYLLNARPMYSALTTAELLELHVNLPAPRLCLDKRLIPQRLETLYLKMVAKDPEDRPPSMREVHNDLSSIAEDSETINRTTRRNWLIGGLSGLGGITSVGIWLTSQREVSAEFQNSLGQAFSRFPDLQDSSTANLAQRVAWSQTPVTWKQFHAVMNPTVVTVNQQESLYATVNWEEAHEFCNRLNRLPQEQAARRHYRLPADAEWQILEFLEIKLNSEHMLATDHRLRRQFQRWQEGLLKDNFWSWCSDNYLNEIGPRSVPSVPPSKRLGQYPIRGGTGLFIHNFDLFMDMEEWRIQQEGLVLNQEADARTRYLMPVIPGALGTLIYHYQFAEPVQSATLFAKLWALKSSSYAILEVSCDGSNWTKLRRGTDEDAHRHPEDLTSLVAGEHEIYVRLSLRERDSRLIWSQGLRTNTSAHLQFPYVYQLLVESQPTQAKVSSRLLAPGVFRHSRLGLRLICDVL